MPIRNNATQWGAISIGLHWLTFVLVIGLMAIGLLLDLVPKSPKYLWIFDLHKSTGLTVLALTVLRLCWRLASPAPAPVADTPRWQDLIAKLTHGALYALLLLMPLSGWLYDSAGGLRPLRWFGLFRVPKLSGMDPDIKAFALQSHELLFYALASLILVHAAAALFHHYRLNDVTLLRMWPWAKPRPAPAPAMAPTATEESN